MATSPEGKIKKKLDKLLKEREKRGLWYFNPQAGPFGKAGIPDKLVCAGGHFVGIECKADRTKKPTALQVQCMDKITLAGGTCFVVCDDESMQAAIDFIDVWIGTPDVTR